MFGPSRCVYYNVLLRSKFYLIFRIQRSKQTTKILNGVQQTPRSIQTNATVLSNITNETTKFYDLW
jgi:hypothetical protein